MNPKLLWLPAIALFLLGACSQPTSTAGGGSVIGNPPIASTLQDQAGHPVAYARVSLYRADHNPVAGGKGVAVTLADSGGRFRFPPVSEGSYTLVAAATEGRFLGMLPPFVVTKRKINDTLRVPACVLGSPAAIAIPLGNLGAEVGDFLYLPGTPVFARIDSAALQAGWVTLETVPAGTFSAINLAKAGGGVPGNILTGPVTAIAGQTVVIGPYQAWRQSKKVFINTAAGGAAVAGTVTAFPLLVRFDSTTFDFDLAEDSGQDLRFTKADGKTPLPYQIVRWGRAGSQIWVRLDSVRGGDDSQYIQLFSGRDSAAAQSGGPAVFETSDGFAAAWHLGDDPAAQQPGYLDATRSGNHGYGIGLTEVSRVQGMVGRATALDGNAQSIRVPDADNLESKTFAFSAWINADSLGGRILDKITEKGKDGYSFDTFGGRIRICGAPDCYSSLTPLPMGRFIHVAATFDGDSLRFYLDGAADGATDSLRSVPDNGFDLRIGSTQTGTEGFRGIVDEVWISRVARPAGWIKLGYENQKPGSRVVTIR